VQLTVLGGTAEQLAEKVVSYTALLPQRLKPSLKMNQLSQR
jgi:hypothetical protein